MDTSPLLHLPQGVPLNLGLPVKIYRQDIRSRIVFAVRLLIWAALVICFSYLYFIWGRAEVRQGSELIALVIGAVMIGVVSAITLPGLYRHLTQWHDVAIEFTEGIAHLHKGAWDTARWAEIAEVTRKEQPADYWGGAAGGESLAIMLVPIMGFLRGSTKRYVISVSESRSILISETLGRSKQLMDTIQGRTFLSRRERALTVLKAGQNAVFGHLYVNARQGISQEAEWHAWEAVEAVQGGKRTGNYIALKPSRGLLRSTIKIMECDIPNGDILLSLVSGRNELST